MKPESGFFKNPSGQQLFFRTFTPEQPSGLLLILHGHGEHSGRYKKFATELEDENLAIAMFDFRGTGRSEGERVYVDDLEDYLQDVTSFVAFLRERFAFAQRLILFGHSLGGLTATHWALRHSEQVKGLILSSPCFGLGLPGFLKSFNAFMNRRFPHFKYSRPVIPRYLSHDPEEVSRYCQDPYIQRKISVRLLHEMLRWAAMLHSQEPLEADFPFYVLAAGLEKVVCLEQTQKVVNRLRAAEKEIEIFEGFYHEIFNETEQNRVFEALRHRLARLRAIDR